MNKKNEKLNTSLKSVVVAEEAKGVSGADGVFVEEAALPGREARGRVRVHAPHPRLERPSSKSKHAHHQMYSLPMSSSCSQVTLFQSIRHKSKVLCGYIN